MTLHRLLVRVPGKPAVLTATAAVAESWKRSVANAARERWSHPFITEACGLTLVFRLDEQGMKSTSLHNLLKATIDGLSHVVFEPGGPGHPGPWNNHDWWITHLSAKKVLATENPCVDIIIAPLSFRPWPRRDDPCIDVSIPGRAPLYAADAKREIEWRAKLVDAIADSYVDPIDNVAVDYQFVIGQGQMMTCDIDNFIVPAAPSTAAALFGRPNASRKITTITATKSPDTRQHPVGTRVRIWNEGSPIAPNRFVWEDGDVTISYPNAPAVSSRVTKEMRELIASTFIDDDAGYIHWRDTHPDGYIINTARKPQASYLKLHRSTCHCMNHLQPGYEHWTKDYIKICGDTIEELSEWARANVAQQAQLQPCRVCKPGPL